MVLKVTRMSKISKEAQGSRKTNEPRAKACIRRTPGWGGGRKGLSTPRRGAAEGARPVPGGRGWGPQRQSATESSAAVKNVDGEPNNALGPRDRHARAERAPTEAPGSSVLFELLGK